MTSSTDSPSGSARRPRSARFLDNEQRADFLAQWSKVQTGFVADPVKAVRAAEQLLELVAQAVTDQVAIVKSSALDDPPRDGRGEGAGPDARDPGPSRAGSGDPDTGVPRARDPEPRDQNAGDHDARDQDTEQLRIRLLRCRAAFTTLVDS